VSQDSELGSASAASPTRSGPASPARGGALKRLFLQSAAASIANLCVMGGLFLRDVYAAAVFGRSAAVDAYFLALMVPQMAVQMLGSGLQASIVPAYTRVAGLGDAPRKRRLVEALNSRLLLFSGAVAAVLWVLGGSGLAWLARVGERSSSELAEHLLWVLVPMTLLEVMGALWAAFLQAEDRVVEAIASRLAVPLGAVLAMLLFAHSAGIYALAWGTLCGSAAQLVWRGASLRRIGTSLRPRLHRGSEELRGVLRQYFPVMLGGAIGSLTNAVDNTMAALSREPAAVSALSYGSRVATVFTTAGTVAVSAAVLPYLSRLSAREDFAELRRTVRIVVSVILLVALPVTVLVLCFSEELVRLVFQRGQFNAADTLLVARVQRMFVLQVPVFVTSIFFVRVLSALRRNDVLLYIAIGGVLTNAVLDYVLMQWLGVAGIALATSLVYVGAALAGGSVVYSLLRERWPKAGDSSLRAPAGDR
jgi:putative peptidoglycan lipid II flippase